MRFTFFEDFLSLVFPKTCCVCKRSLFVFENQLCKVCIGSLPITNYHQRPQNNELSLKILGLTKPNLVISFLQFTKKGTSQKLLHQLKYRNKPEIGVELGRIYAHILSEWGFGSHWDYIIPVPLHPIKLKRRGYNQSEQFALGLSEILGVPISRGLQRDQFTDTQTQKSRMERLENVANVFSARYFDEIKGKRILLVDDVMTTGATLTSCANSLLMSGAVTVDLAVIAAGK
ncbi:ComF family protein [Rhodonellum sp.]|uniref:ComF family protein n=1 Tax=Rhodonellum sp. TaxID=2231180 RepID=UPI00271C56D1|nr:phosphoribosyltransferase family protein [Rhodonellum sp.]MDO9552629.1 phosphoribosyltransferase family protein [Rhodonellum sp.]